MAEPGWSPPGPRFEVTCKDTKDALHTPPGVVHKILGTPTPTAPPGHIYMGPTSRGAAGVQWWRLILRVLGRGRDFAADALKKGGRALPEEWVGRAMVLVQAVLGEEQPGKTWGSSFSIPTSGLSERGKGLRRERRRAPAEGRQLRGSWRLRKGEEAQGGGTQRKEGNHEWRGVRRRKGGSVEGSEIREEEGVREGRGGVRAQEESVMGGTVTVTDSYRPQPGPAEVFPGALCPLTLLGSPPFTFLWIMRMGWHQLS